MNDDTLRYPIGRFTPGEGELDADTRARFIQRIEGLPVRARAAVAGLDDGALDTPYRPQGWTPRQIVHHLADSHMNAFVRIKLALTEDHPTIKPYDQEAWAGLVDSTGAPESSLSILEGLHERWVLLLRSLEEDAFGRTVNHPEIGAVTLSFFLQLYAWHGDHHVTQIEELRDRKGW